MSNMMDNLTRDERNELAQLNSMQVQTPLPARVTLHLNAIEWQMLTKWVLDSAKHTDRISDKYMRALMHPLLKQVYVKLHNKLHSLKSDKNSLNLTLPEASILVTTLLELDTQSYLALHIVGIIDQKLS